MQEPDSSDSGLIDFMAIQRKAREEKEQAAANPTPVPVTFSRSPSHSNERSLSHSSGLDPLAADAQRRRKRLQLGAIVGGVAMLAGVLLTLAFSGGSAPAADVAAAVPPPTVVAAPAAAPPPPPAVVTPPPAAPVIAPAVAAADPEPVAPKPHSKKKVKKHASQGKGPKMIKVHSAGT